MNLRDLVGDQLAQTGLGLAIGTAARYAMRIQDRLPIGRREILADILLLGINALLTLFVIERLGTTGKGAILTAALFGIAQDRVIRALRQRFEKRAAAIEAAVFGEEQSSAPEKPRAPRKSRRHHTGKALRDAHQDAVDAPLPSDLTDLTDKLDKEP